MTVPARIMFVDDEVAIQRALGPLMRSRGYVVHTFGSAEEFLSSSDSVRTSCVVADVHMPLMTGIDLLTQMRAQGSATPFILITGFPDESLRARALEAGAVCCLGKPFRPADLMQCLQWALAAGDDITE